MASYKPLSNSIRKRQIVKVCQLCECDPNIKWKCLECELVMCQKCTDKVHKIVSARDHTIIAIKDISEHHHQMDSDEILLQMEFEPISKPDLTQIKCGIHSGQNYCLYCKICQTLVCQICIFKRHMKHEFDEICEEYTNRLAKIKNRKKNVEKDIQTLTKSKEFLKQQTITRKSYYEQVKQNILEDERAVVAEVKNNTAKLFNELDLKWKSFSKIIDVKDNQLTDKLTKSQEQLEQICHLFQHSKAKDVFKFYDSLLVSVDAKFLPELLAFNEVAQFRCADKAKLVQILGKLEDGTASYITDLQVEKKFESKLKCIDRITSGSDDHLWICDFDSRMAQKVKLSGDNPIVRERINFNMKVYDAALLPPNELLLSVEGSSNLKLIPSGATELMDSVYTVSPFKQPVGVHVTRRNRIIVGVGSYERMGEVIVMDETGKHKKHFKTSNSLKAVVPGFLSLPYNLTFDSIEIEYPVNISSNSKCMIAAVVSTEISSQPRVVILDKKGKLRKEYTGHLDVNNKYNPFKPRGITATPSDNFVVADTPNHTLHVLNSEGEFLTLFNTQKIGILLPCSLSFSTTGQLFIGCTTYEGKLGNAKIFKVLRFFY